MKQKTQYFILLILAAALIYTYTWDGIRVRDEAKEIQQRISTINEHLKSGAEIMNETVSYTHLTLPTNREV